MVRKIKLFFVFSLIAIMIPVIIATIIMFQNKYNEEDCTIMNLLQFCKNTDRDNRVYKRDSSSRSSELMNIVLSSPWLYPKSRTLFPYIGLHNDLDALLKTMAHQSKKIMILGFDWHWQSMIQNNIYTLVRFARTTNFIVPTGDEISLHICIELNLPCYRLSFIKDL